MAETQERLDIVAVTGELRDDFAPINTWDFDTVIDVVFTPTERVMLREMRKFLVSEGAIGPFKICHLSPGDGTEPQAVTGWIDGKRHYAAALEKTAERPAFPPHISALLHRPGAKTYPYPARSWSA